MRSALSSSDRDIRRLRWAERSSPRAAMAFTDPLAARLAGAPQPGRGDLTRTPALARRWRSNASAIGDRHTLPVQRKTTSIRGL